MDPQGHNFSQLLHPPFEPSTSSQVISVEKKIKKKTKTSYACKECKRLKLKCDKKFPCSSCVKRGCSRICPDGSLVTGKGSRFILSGSEQLHEKIDVLTERVRSLEGALEVMQLERNPDERHPLLSDELLKLKFATDLGNPSSQKLSTPPVAPDDDDDDDASDDEQPKKQSGTLAIDSTGTSTYFGSTARTEYFLLGVDDLGLPDNPTPIDILLLSQSFPFTSLVGTQEDLAKKLHSKLPPRFESDRLVDLYHTRVNWLYDPLPDSEEYVDFLHQELYHNSSRDIDLHRLSLLYMIHALGHLLDLDRDPYSAEATRCFELAKACLALKPVLDFPSIHCIQSMFLMCYYLLLGNKKPDAAWTLMGLIVKIAQSIGLHRDDFELEEIELQTRRLLWWEIVTLEGWISLGFGRPPSVRLLAVNCKFPKYKSSAMDSGYRGWMHQFGRNYLPPILEVALGTKTPVYAAITETERKVSKSHVPPMLEVTRTAGFGNEQPSSALRFQRAMVATARALTVLKLHLGWFTQALSENPTDLRKSKYYASVEAVHNSACTLIASLHHLSAAEFSMVCRFGLFWSNTLSSAVPLCLIATRSPTSELAAHSLREVEHCYEIFARASSSHCHVAHASLPTLARLRDKARQSMIKNMGGAGILPPRIGSHDPEEEELERLGGKTKLLRGSSRDTLAAYSLSVPSSSTDMADSQQYRHTQYLPHHSQNYEQHHSLPQPQYQIQVPPLRPTLPPIDSSVTYDYSHNQDSRRADSTGLDNSHGRGHTLPPLQQVAYQHPTHTDPHSYQQPPPQQYHNLLQPVPQQYNQQSRYLQPPYQGPSHTLSATPQSQGNYIQPLSTDRTSSEADFRYAPDESAQNQQGSPVVPPPQEAYPVTQQNWSGQYSDQTVFPPYAPMPQHGMMETEYYDQQSDYMVATVPQDNQLYQHQQQLWHSMLQSL